MATCSIKFAEERGRKKQERETLNGISRVSGTLSFSDMKPALVGLRSLYTCHTLDSFHSPPAPLWDPLEEAVELSVPLRLASLLACTGFSKCILFLPLPLPLSLPLSFHSSPPCLPPLLSLPPPLLPTSVLEIYLFMWSCMNILSLLQLENRASVYPFLTHSSTSLPVAGIC